MLAAASAAAQPRFEVLGGRADAGPGRLEIGVRLANRGTGARDVHVTGELEGHEASRLLEGTFPGGGEREVRLDFPSRLDRPGLHAVVLRIASRPEDGDAGEPLLHQLSYLGFPLGASPAPAFELEVAPTRIGWSGELTARLHSLEGTPHRVGLRVLAAPGLRPFPERHEVELPGGARRRVPLGLLRAGARPDTRQGVLVEARVLDGPLERAQVVATDVEVSPHRGRLPGLRKPLLVLAMALLAGALLAEVARFRRS